MQKLPDHIDIYENMIKGCATLILQLVCIYVCGHMSTHTTLKGGRDVSYLSASDITCLLDGVTYESDS